MSKKHIVSIGYYYLAFDSIKAATDCLVLLNKATLCDRDYKNGRYNYKPDNDPHRGSIDLTLNQDFGEARKPEKEAKPLALPKPKRGTIRCICGFSDVAPRQECTHCGRPFSESHNRTHQSDSAPSHPTLRLL